MKLSLLPSILFTATGLAEFVRVPLPEPLDWVASKELNSRHVCKDLHAPYSQYNAETWADRVLGVCNSTLCGCTSTLSYSELVHWGIERPYWVGRMFTGASTTALDYDRKHGIEDSIAYTSTSWEE
ncbi:hypothetical protein X797_009329 [Metarhizium robertsii]|uniref:Uncharacterized protein n=2 Tax=Metarhizium robertsii TaxID=568076 RepID=E9EK63_METRA|nr:uncharacterized protein MAA_00477 [Metarhizium robertsii ARSEF 23]EFZ03403.1 hypothetical protein MAA_00477 [Metarhizium robertsii ARSEF 23]EXU97609.1 hypothetical protein X797_009329 [Metarhizium robertsii]